ncbi:unnamed protein product [Timema podura]|uniref:1-acyl-sn-glycerol-3-phosphate acyltransferase n=1 Tax=Timema podura TaxID=61482 RepID=A0ABN7NBL3_TIMPD|nr:unnamed protein product [Timema podura]
MVPVKHAKLNYVANLIVKHFGENVKTLSTTVNHISKLLKHVTKLIGITWELRNGEILAEERGAVIVANHQSMIDILGMFNIWEVMDKCAAIAKKEIFYVWPFGLAAWLGGVVYIDRLNGPKAHEQIDKAAKLSVTHKVKLWIFPEGTRNDGGDNMLPFKRGAFKVAIGCQVPIIPVVFSPYYFINHKKRYFGQGKDGPEHERNQDGSLVAAEHWHVKPKILGSVLVFKLSFFT